MSSTEMNKTLGRLAGGWPANVLDGENGSANVQSTAMRIATR
jgi:hypothetical protein